MAKSDTFELALLRLIFNAAPIAGLADDAADGPATALYVSLHTDDPGDDGDQTANEVAYGNYARRAVVRSVAGWSVTQADGVTAVAPLAPIPFPPGTTGSGIATHFGIGLAASGAGPLLYRGTIAPPQPIGSGATPILATTTSVSED